MNFVSPGVNVLVLYTSEVTKQSEMASYKLTFLNSNDLSLLCGKNLYAACIVFCIHC